MFSSALLVRPMIQYSNGGSSQWTAFKIRAFIAVAIAIFTFVSYLLKGDINPVTGEKQRVGMTVDQEIALGLESSGEMASQHGGLHADAHARAEVNRIGNRLLEALQKDLAKDGKTDPYKFDFHLLADEETINAFSLPGGPVFITHALYSQLTTEGQVAGVLGHEIGHVLSRHSAQHLAKANLEQGLAGAVGVAGGTRSSAQIAAMVGHLIDMKYGRGDELEADKWGVKLSALAGYDPRAMLGVMDVLEKSGGGRQPEIMSTHPKPANRKGYIEEVIREVFPHGVPEGLDE